MKIFNLLLKLKQKFYGYKVGSYNDMKFLLDNKEYKGVFWGMLIRISGDDEVRMTFGYDECESGLKYIEKNLRKELDRKCAIICMDDRQNIFIVGKKEESVIKAEIEAKSICEIIAETVNNSIEIKNRKLHFKCNIGGVIWHNSLSKSEIIINNMHNNLMDCIADNKKFIISEYRVTNEKKNADIVEIIKNNELSIVIQPVVELKSGKAIFCEAFLRMDNDESTKVHPSEVVEWAENLGVGMMIDEKIMRMACKEILNWDDYEVSPEFISVNVSRYSINRKDFINDIKMIVDEYGINYSRIGIEINGRDMGAEFNEDWVEVTNKLKKLGFKIIIDDFIKSNFHIKSLIRYNIDFIKLDGSIISEITKSKEAKDVAEVIVKLCKSLNIGVVAEEVEEQSQVRVLREINCDFYQGNVFSKPVNTAIVEKIFNKG